MPMNVSESWDGGTPGSGLSAGTTAFSSYGGGGLVQYTADSLFGTTAALLDSNNVAPGAFAKLDLDAAYTTIYQRVYLKMTVATATYAAKVLGAYSSGVPRGVVGSSSTGNLQLLSPHAVKATSSGTYFNDWVRIEHSVTGSTQKLDIFAGSNLHTGTPTETLTSAVTNSTGFNMTRLGDANADSVAAIFDSYAMSTVAMPSPLADPTPANGMDSFLWDGTSLVAVDAFLWNGTTLIAVDPEVSV